MTFTGTVDGINAALNGLNFKPSPDYAGPASIVIAVNDLGNGGTGGTKTAPRASESTLRGSTTRLPASTMP